MTFCIITPWHNEEQKDNFLSAWGITDIPDWIILQHDSTKQGCAKTKNTALRKIHDKFDVAIVLDDDCYPDEESTLEEFASKHLEALKPQPVDMYEVVTNPPSRGTPYFNRSVTMPVAASMGFWIDNPDYDAPGQLIHGTTPMEFRKKTVFGKFFPFSGMNCAFRTDFWPHFEFDESADRFDDIFMGYRLQKEAYKHGHCINLNGPTVRHVRQSNVWKNLQVEAINLERNETEWALSV